MRLLVAVFLGFVSGALWLLLLAAVRWICLYTDGG